jgi:hypothetical protein
MFKIFDLMIETALQQEKAAIKNEMKQNEDPKLRKMKDRALMTIIYKILEDKK